MIITLPDKRKTASFLMYVSFNIMFQFLFHFRNRRSLLLLNASYLHKKFQRNKLYYVWIMT